MKHIALTALLFCFAHSAWGAGYQLRYQGAETMGTAFASAGSYGDSLSSIYYNPALFLLQGKEKGLAVELLVLHPVTAEFTSSAGQVSDDYADTSLSGGLYYGHKIDDDTAITIAITTPWGTSTDYDDQWDGRYHALETDLAAINMQPMISKRLSEKFLLSVGPQIQYMTGSLSSATDLSGLGGDLVNTFDGDDIAVGGVLAVTYMPTEKTTLALNYTSEVKHHLRGDVKFSPTSIATTAGLANSNNADTELTTPEVVTLSVSHKFSDKLVGHFSGSYTAWSVFEELAFTVNNTPSSTVNIDWDDTTFVAAGATYKMNDKLILRGGVSYEEGAVKNAIRTPRTQDTDRIGLGLGASMAVGKVNLDFGLSYIIYTGDIDLEIASQGPATGSPFGTPGVTGSYDNEAALLRVGAEYRF